VPSCRSGFLCQSGACISACNPPCPAGQLCTAQGECASGQPQYAPPPPPRAFPTPDYKPPSPTPPLAGVYKHDGFLLRGVVGFGLAEVASAPVDEDDAEKQYFGLSLLLSVDIGAAVIENLSLHARVGLATINSPTLVDQNGNQRGAESISMFLLAAGATFNIMPSNLYTSAVFGITGFGFGEEEGSNQRYTSDAGFGFNLDFGKEWWVGRQWGIGVAGRLAYASAGTESASGVYDHSSWAGYVMFSTTFQ
jgi:hypothetical protein